MIIAFVVVVWAAYFVPLVLRRYDEAGRNAGVEDAGERGRVIRTKKAPAVDQVEKPDIACVPPFMKICTPWAMAAKGPITSRSPMKS